MWDKLSLWLPPLLHPYLRSWLTSWKWIIGGTLGVSLAVGLWQFLQPKEYRCEVEFVPPSLERLSYLPPMLAPATPTDMERFFSYLQSSALWSAVIDSFRLAEHYKLNHIADSTRLLRALAAELKSRTSFRITRNSTLHFSILDQDPMYAYRMALFVLDKIREQIEFFTKDRSISVQVTEAEMLLDKEIEGINRKLSALRRSYGIVTLMQTDAGRLNLSFRDSRTPEALSHYDEVASLERTLAHLIELKSKLTSYRLERAHHFLIYRDKLWVIQPPTPPKIPAYPRPSLWIALSATVTFLLLSLLSFYLHYLKKHMDSPASIAAFTNL
ncbi:MAG: hypothetical protein RMK19_04050 [Bacteroidia bacterium]|nr:hypothetical protein [Bacteroidia bacterium]MDW8015163.1 hypothetical protein [Bacteroidia bacterium]